MAKRSFLLVVLLAAAVFGQQAVNLWEGGDFEANGVPGGRSGNCGHLQSDVKVHWKNINQRQINVKRYATYELSAYVKGEQGNALALYSYNYNCYGWFGAGDPHPVVKNMKEWTRVTRRIFTIQDTIYVMPLAFLDGGPGEAFVDDMAMVEIASPEETFQRISAKTDKTSHERQLLMRWHLDHGDAQAAWTAINPNDRREVAEFHCLMAQRATSEDDKLEHVTGLLAAGCYDFPDAHLRMAELMKNVDRNKWIDACLKGLEAYKGNNPRHLTCLAAKNAQISQGTWAENTASLKALQNSREKIKTFMENQSKQPGREWMKGGLDSVDEAIATIEKNLHDYGNCQISLAGKPLEQFVIVKPANATPSEENACKELRRLLEKQSRTLLEIVDGDAPDGKLPIYMGRVPEAKRAAWPVDYEKLRFDGIHVELRPDGLLLGGGQRGVLYAMYDFLEEQLGWRWFASDCTVFPKTGAIDVSPMKKTHVPPFDYRRTSYKTIWQNPQMIVPLKLSAMDMDRPEWGGNYMYRGWVHTFNALVPLSKYGATHPEYYSLVKGKRLLDRTQLCLTNPDVKRIATETVLDWLRQSEKLPFAVSVSQNDWRNYCECENCKALAEKEESQAGPLLHFVNAIAAEVEKEFPTVKVDTLAYQYTRKAPKFVKPAHNVIVRLCSIECCFAHGLDECDFNRSFVKDIEDWSKIAPYLSVWDYTINFAHSTQPFPNLRTLQKNVKFYQKWGVRGLFEQGNNFTLGGEFQDLRAYLIAKLLWDSDFDVEKGIREFTDGYYGPAAPYIREYIHYMHDWLCGPKGTTSNTHVRIYAHPSTYLNDNVKLDIADAMLEMAEQAAKGDETFARRAAVAHMPLWYTRLQLATSRYYLRGDKLVATSSTDCAAIAKRFENAAAAVKLTAIREGGNHDQYMAWLKSKMVNSQKDVELVKLSNDYGNVTVIPSMGGRIWSCKDLNGREMMKIFGDDSKGYDPFNGGYEEYSSAEYQSAGWREVYDVTEHDVSHVTMKASLGNGKTLTRRIELLSDRAGFKVTSELIGKGPQVLRIHPAFTTDLLKNTSLFIHHGDRSENVKLSETESTNLYFREGDRPTGKWGFVNRKTGYGIVNTFDASQIDFCYVNAKHEEQRLNLEQWSKPKEGRVTMTNTYEFWK